MVVIQFGYFVIAWSNLPILLSAFLHIYPLRYAIGMSVELVREEESGGTGNLVENGQSGSQNINNFGEPYGHFGELLITSTSFANNFNVMLGLQVLPAVVAIIGSINMQYFKYRKGKVAKSGRCKEEKAEADRKCNAIEKRIYVFRVIQSLSFQMLMFWSIFNLPSFICLAYLFFVFDRSLTKKIDYLLFVVGVILYILVVTVYLAFSDVFNDFYDAFKKNKFGVYCYTLYLLTISATMVLLCLGPSGVLGSVIPFSVVMLYTVLFRPYN
jgi:hypothetical protein